jgi:hypothetical protein
MRQLFVVPVIALVAGVLASVPATAATTCQDQFDVLDAATQSVAITATKADKERAGLLKLAEDAEALAALGKISDAVTKAAIACLQPSSV